MDINLSVKILGKKFRHPLVLASGILGTSFELMIRMAKLGVGAITSKSCGLNPRKGYENPTVLDWGHGLINAVGLTNPGVLAEVEILKKTKKELAKMRVILIASFFGETIEEFGKVAKIISKAKPDFLEVNISCPNIKAGRMFAASTNDTYQVIKTVKRNTDLPFFVKLSPNVSNIKEIAKAIESAGACGITATNTFLGMIIDTSCGKPILTNKTGGVSGPAIKPLSIRYVYEVCSAVKIPVIGMGGVITGNDALEMIMVGATLVGIGSAVYYRGFNVFKKIEKEMVRIMKINHYPSLEKIRGLTLHAS